MKHKLTHTVSLTIPVMTGYLFLGASYGVLGYSQGIPSWLLILSSLIIYAGSAQFASIGILQTAFNPVGTAFLILMINARHIFYGITMLDKYRNIPQPAKSYNIFGLTDETFSLVSSLEYEKATVHQADYFWITLLDQLYWVAGTVIGVLFGRYIPFDTNGIEFVLTALFWTIFVDQWLDSSDHRPAITGVLASLICLLIFGAGNFMIPSIIAILAVFLWRYYREGGAHA